MLYILHTTPKIKKYNTFCRDLFVYLLATTITQYPKFEISIMGYCPISREANQSNCTILGGSRLAFTNKKLRTRGMRQGGGHSGSQRKGAFLWDCRLSNCSNLHDFGCGSKPMSHPLSLLYRPLPTIQRSTTRGRAAQSPAPRF